MNSIYSFPHQMVFMAIFFAIIVGLSFLGAFAFDKFKSKWGFAKSLTATFLAIAVSVSATMGLPLWGMKQLDAHHLKVAQQLVKSQHGLDLLPETKEGKPVFDFINGQGASMWQVQIFNGAQVYDMNLKFDEKSGEAILSFPDRNGVPSPEYK